MPHERPATMQAVAPSGPGGPEVLIASERPVPEPSAGQVLIRVSSAGVNRHDCNQRKRGSGPKGATDILGLEVAGEIVASGPGVVGDQEGRKVAALINGGGYANYALAEAELVFDWPDRLSAQEAAGLPEALFTLQLNLVEMGSLGSGDWVLLHGGAGGVGSIGIAFAKRLGAHVAVTAGTDEKCDFARALGADLAVNYRRDDFVAAVQEATDGRGANVILDVVGADMAARNLAALASDGTLLHLSPTGDLSLPLRDIMVKRARLSGALLRATPPETKARLARDLRAGAWQDAGTVFRPQIDRVFPLAESAEAHARMEASSHMGKIILDCT
jgi:NADPH2:quinone reductase